MGLFIPRIPRVLKEHVFQTIKKTVNECARLIERGWIVDGIGTTVTDSPTGKGRCVNVTAILPAGGTASGPGTGNTSYVMGSSRDGSLSPTTWDAPPARSEAQLDTYYSWDPPRMKSVAITSNNIANPTVITTAAAHLIPATDGPYFVFIAGVTGSTPDINGTRLATYIDATTFSIEVDVTNGGSGGTMARVCNSCTINEEPRFYKIASGSGAFSEKVWTRQKQFWIDGRFAVYGETLANTALITGSGSGGGGLP